MAEQGLMAPLPLILQPCNESDQLDAEASLPNLLSIQVGGLHVQECNDKVMQLIMAHLLLDQQEIGHAEQV